MKAAKSRSPRQWLTLLSLMYMLLLGTTAVSAQATPTPISIGENQFGSITSVNGNAQYRLAVTIPQRVEIQVLGITSGFAPTFVVLEPNGGLVSFTYSIAKQGRSNTGPFTLRLCVSTTCFDQVYSGIWAGGGTGGSFNIGEWPTGTTASYVFAIDFANDVNEADETNNLKNGIVHF